MRKTWIAAWVAIGLATGCAGTKMPFSGSSGGAMAQNGATATQQVGAKASWSDKLLAPLAWMKPSPQAAQQKKFAEAQASAAKRQVSDPLQLANTKEPTAAMYLAMADMACHGGNAPQARGLYQKALSLEPKNLAALLGAARMEDREGRLDVATMLYGRAAEAYPNNSTVLNDLGLCFARQGKLPEAERALMRAVQLEPAKPLYRNNIAKVLVEVNRMDEAMHQLAAVNPPAVVNYNIGAMLFQRGRYAESERFLAAALTVDPQMEPARVLLAELRPATQEYRTARAMPVTPTGEIVAGGAVAETPGAPQIIETSAAVIPGTESEPVLLPPVN